MPKRKEKPDDDIDPLYSLAETAVVKQVIEEQQRILEEQPPPSPPIFDVPRTRREYSLDELATHLIATCSVCKKTEHLFRRRKICAHNKCSLPNGEPSPLIFTCKTCDNPSSMCDHLANLHAMMAYECCYCNRWYAKTVIKRHKEESCLDNPDSISSRKKRMGMMRTATSTSRD